MSAGSRDPGDGKRHSLGDEQWKGLFSLGSSFELLREFLDLAPWLGDEAFRFPGKRSLGERTRVALEKIFSATGEREFVQGLEELVVSTVLGLEHCNLWSGELGSK